MYVRDIRPRTNGLQKFIAVTVLSRMTRTIKDHHVGDSMHGGYDILALNVCMLYFILGMLQTKLGKYIDKIFSWSVTLAFSHRGRFEDGGGQR